MIPFDGGYVSFEITGHKHNVFLAVVCRVLSILSILSFYFKKKILKEKKAMFYLHEERG